ncbi:CotD family spore coat protein [Ornithinibacillus salinisoli]|uniref:CotD family spore coat protein n=1 Tax=Ornithinibacillus salinisoli TaxID=1848459 RepID=A0ABW4VWU8_9BACI
MRHRPRPHCGPKKIVHPTQCNVVHCCSEETVDQIHPSHTTVMNHHLIKNQHYYPHSTSVVNTVNSVDVFGGAYNVPSPGPGVGGPGVGGPGVGGPGMAGPGMAGPGMGGPGMGGPGMGGPGMTGPAGRPPAAGANPWR